MKPILVATDFSSNALNAAYYAVDMAKSISGYVVLFHVYEMPLVATEVPLTVDPGLMIESAGREMKKLEQLVMQHSHGGVIIETIVRGGTFFHELEMECQERKPYVVVMGSQGANAAERFLFGTHTLYAMKHLPWPVMAVPPYIKFSSIARIGFACDFSEVVATTPLDELKTLVKDFNAELHVLNTGKAGQYDPDLVFQSGLLQEMLYALKPAYHFITNDDIDAGIIDFADRNLLDLLIVSPRRHNLIDRLLHKSHTKQLVLHSHVPVMALHN